MALNDPRHPSQALWRNLLALTLALAGALFGTWVGLPAGPLIGASLAVTLAAWAGLSPRIDDRLRNGAFVVIGVSLGAGITPGTLQAMAGWIPSLILLSVSVICTLLVAAWLLRRVFGHSRDTALLASSPGTLSFALAVAMDGRGDVTAVLVMQCLRLLILVSALPLLMRSVGILPATTTVLPGLPMALPAMSAVFAGGFALGWTGTRLRIPAAYLIGGMLASGLSHGSGIAAGPPPQLLVWLAFTVTGGTIGARFAGVAKSDLLRFSVSAFAVVGAAAAVSLAFALVAAAVSDLPVAETWVAFAPGGVEAMAAIGLALGFDPAYIALHHLARILTLVVALPIILGRVPEPEPAKPCSAP